MAAVTVDTGWFRTVVNGHMREWLYHFDIADDADYLDVPLKIVKSAHLSDDTIGAVGIASVTLNASGFTSRVVFNTAGQGAVTNVFARFMGW